jgi:hypothetical protein
MRYSPARRAFLVIIATLSLIFAVSARAQQATVYIQIDGGPPYTGTVCNTDIAPGSHTAYVVVHTSHPFQSIRFTAPVPAGSFWTGDIAMGGGIATGNSQTGVEVEYFSCLSGYYIPVLQVSFYAPGAYNDYTWTVGPAAGQPTIELEDCDGFVMKGAGGYSIYCDPQMILAPYRPDPPDGAVDVPTNTLLNFVGSANEVGVADHPIGAPYDGNVFYCLTTPYPSTVDPCEFPLDPGALQPNTTYYWRAYNICWGCSDGDVAFGDLWSFTTGDAPLATEQTTWGRVKAMYRE